MNDLKNSQTRPDESFAYREWLRPFASGRHLAILTAVILVFAWLGPFGTGARLSTLELVLYWSLAIGLNWGLGLLIIPLSLFLMRPLRKPELISLVLGALVAALPGTGVIFLLELWFSEPPSLASELAYLYATVAIIHVLLGYLARELIGRSSSQAPTASVGASSEGVAFLSRLSPTLGENLLHLRMRDHYVEAHTDKGSELVLMRFGDALKEVEGLDGARVHRSHWVASRGVRRTHREQGRTFVELSNGEQVPVSRSYKAALEGIDHQRRDRYP